MTRDLCELLAPYRRAYALILFIQTLALCKSFTYLLLQCSALSSTLQVDAFKLLNVQDISDVPDVILLSGRNRNRIVRNIFLTIENNPGTYLYCFQSSHL